MKIIVKQNLAVQQTNVLALQEFVGNKAESDTFAKNYVTSTYIRLSR